jgi:hypothetical protein
MRWISRRWAIAIGLGAVAMALAITLDRGKREDGLTLAGAALSQRKSAAPGESGINEAPWREDLDRLTREVAVLRAELKRLAAVVEGTLVDRTASVDEGEVGAPLSHEEGLAPDPETIDAWDIEELERETREKQRAAAEEMEVRKEEHVERLDAIIQQQAVDTEWAGEAETRIRGALEFSELKTSRLMGVDCRTTACRMTVHHKDQAAAEAFQMIFIQQVGDLLPNALMTHFDLDGGESETVVHLARDGYRLPRVPR